MNPPNSYVIVAIRSEAVVVKPREQRSCWRKTVTRNDHDDHEARAGWIHHNAPSVQASGGNQRHARIVMRPDDFGH